jgi:hypothetical protein
VEGVVGNPFYWHGIVHYAFIPEVLQSIIRGTKMSLPIYRTQFFSNIPKCGRPKLDAPA